MTSKQLILLRGAVINGLAGIREDFLPQFTETAALKNGAVVIRGEDKMALNWLTERIERISPWEDAKLRVMDLDEL